MDRREMRAAMQPVFDQVWKAYPLHQDYEGGFQAFLDLIEDGVDPAMLEVKARRYAANVDPENLKYVPHLKSWLRNRRFTDEDLFTDRLVADREWFVTAYRNADAAAVERKFGFVYADPPIPNDVTDIAKWCEDDRRRWVAVIANHVLHGKPLPE